jgi:prepilin-type N-terminal cleavage/methylation domain-containing protein/prepilin-type processing-associated H-X9-DG protein
MMRRALTLLELLVSLAIIAVMMAMLLPAVQKVRSMANRLSCQSNLRQLGLSLHHYESVTGKLPPAHRSGNQTTTPLMQWPIYLAPYYEQAATADRAIIDYKRSPSPIAKNDHEGMRSPIKLLSCPNDPRVSIPYSVSLLMRSSNQSIGFTKVDVAVMSYLGSAGATSAPGDGVIIVNSNLTMLSITDGTSNTLAFGERPPPPNMLYGWLYAGWGNNDYGALDSVIGVSDLNAFPPTHRYSSDCGRGPFPYQPIPKEPFPNKAPCEMFQFWSLHDAGANFAFADGSVRFLPYSAKSILPGLATRSGGEVVGIDE